MKARKAMEVEIEDLHLQIDDIAKAKTAVRNWGAQGRAKGDEGCDSGSRHPKQEPCLSQAPSHQGFPQGERPPSSVSPTNSRGLGREQGGRGSQPGPISLFNSLPVGAWPQAPTP